MVPLFQVSTTEDDSDRDIHDGDDEDIAKTPMTSGHVIGDVMDVSDTTNQRQAVLGIRRGTSQSDEEEIGWPVGFREWHTRCTLAVAAVTGGSLG